MKSVNNPLLFLLCAILMFRVATAFSPTPIANSFQSISSNTRLRLSDEPSSEVDNKPSTPPPPPVKCPDCDLCDGSGRIEGGIGTVLTWWPIKAYRPCPNFIDRGGFYQRSGQGLDEIAFGRDSTFDSGN